MDDLTDDGIIVDVELADDHDVEIGDTIHLLLTGGEELDLTVQGITDDEQVLGYFTITATPTWRAARAARRVRLRLDRRRRRPRRGDRRHRRDRRGGAGPHRGGPRGLHRLDRRPDRLLRQLHQHHAAAVDHHRPDRRGEHALPLDQRAGPRARPAARGRHEQDPAQAVDPMGGGDHVACSAPASASSWPS